MSEAQEHEYHDATSTTTFRLGQQVGSGGEGTVYAVEGHQDLLAKLYNEQRLAKTITDPPTGRPWNMQGKVSHMANRKFPLMVNEDGDSVLAIAWPQTALFDEAHNFVGFLMPRIGSPSGHDQFNLYAAHRERERGYLFPDGYDWLSFVRIALNMATVVRHLHENGIVIGDFNCDNILIDGDSHVMLIDTDSFCIPNTSLKLTYRCIVGVGEYTAPELQGQDLESSTLRRTFTKESDCFSLAIHIFMLLMDGFHPFSCKREGAIARMSSSDQPYVQEIANGQSPYVTGSRLTPIPGSPSMSMIPFEIQQLFNRAFSYDARTATLPKTIGNRPSAREWEEALYRLYHGAVADATSQGGGQGGASRKAQSEWRKSAKVPWAYRPYITQINRNEEFLRDKGRDGLREMADDLRDMLSRRHPQSPRQERDSLCMAFSLLKEAMCRHSGVVVSDFQLLAGIVLYEGKVAEQQPGEGRNMAVMLAAFLASLHGCQTHVMSVSDSMSWRDAEEAATVMEPLGVSVGRVYNQQPNIEKRIAYQCDIVYGTPSEFGFDYLRDNMVTRAQDRVQKEHSFAIVVAADTVLIDEATVPVSITRLAQDDEVMYIRFARAVYGLQLALDEEHQDGDYFIDEGKQEVFATERGLRKIEDRLGYEDLYGRPDAPNLVSHLQQALKAEYLLRRDRDYVVIGGEVKVVDGLTGRIMEGHHWLDGLHQAIEAKEGVKINPRAESVARITRRGHCLLYGRLAGITDTVRPDGQVLHDLYSLDVVTIPTNAPVIREDAVDRIFRDTDAKLAGIAQEVAERHRDGQPVLVGVSSVDASERLSRLLGDRNIAHEVLNAKSHAKEAQIVARIGRLGAVTIASDTVGRDAEIPLGGDMEDMVRSFIQQEFPDYGTPKADDEDATLPTDADIRRIRSRVKAMHDAERSQVISVGGLCVIGSEHHKNMRLDEQLRHCAGRRGEPGCCQFFWSFDDELAQLYTGTARMQELADLDDEMAQGALETKLWLRGIRKLQRQVHETVVTPSTTQIAYGEVGDSQCRFLYDRRQQILDGDEDLGPALEDALDAIVTDAVSSYCPSGDRDRWDVDGLCEWLAGFAGGDDVQAVRRFCATRNASEQMVTGYVGGMLHSAYDRQRELLGNDEGLMHIERTAMLKAIDERWASHLSELDSLQAGIGLGRTNPHDSLAEYRHEAHVAFESLMREAYSETLRTVLSMRIRV